MYHPDPSSFATETQELAPVGGIVVALSRLELAHDELVTAIFKKSKKFSLSIAGTFPRRFKPKTDFVVEALHRYPLLRTMPILDDGFLDVQWLQYQLDELYDLRAVLAHGAISFSEQFNGGTVWHLDRIVKGDQKGDWDSVTAKVGSGFLADAAHTSSVIQGYFDNLRRLIEDGFSFEDHYQQQKTISENWVMLHELHELGLIPNVFAGFGDFAPKSEIKTEES